MPCRLKNESTMMGIGNWEAVQNFHVPMYGGLTGYRWALIVESWPAGRQPVFKADEYPPVSIS